MQRTLIILSAVLCVALAQLSPCVSSSCGAIGDVCGVAAGSPCDICNKNLSSCQSNSGFNPGVLCGCYQTFHACASAAGAVCSGVAYGGFVACSSLLPNNLTCCGAPPATIAQVACHQPTSYCNTTTGLCTAVSKSGPCGSRIACGDPTNDVVNPLLAQTPNGYVCTAGQCTFSPNFPAGAPCTDGTVCLTGSCVNNLCVGFSAGTSCTSSGECNKGLFCSAGGSCTALIAAGSACTTSDSCQFGSQCDGAVCVAYTTKTSGQSCVTTPECAIGLTCFPPGAGTCISAPPVKPCTNQTQCQGDARYAASCVCLGGNTYTCPIVVPPDFSSACAAQGIALNNCVKNTGCDSRLIGISCCNNEFACLGNCAGGVFGPALGCGNLIGCTSTSTTHKSAAVSVEVSFLLAVVAMLALLF